MKTKSKEYRLEATDYDSEDILHEENDLSTENAIQVKGQNIHSLNLYLNARF